MGGMCPLDMQSPIEEIHAEEKSPSRSWKWRDEAGVLLVDASEVDSDRRFLLPIDLLGTFPFSPLSSKSRFEQRVDWICGFVVIV